MTLQNEIEKIKDSFLNVFDGAGIVGKKEILVGGRLKYKESTTILDKSHLTEIWNYLEPKLLTLIQDREKKAIKEIIEIINNYMCEKPYEWIEGFMTTPYHNKMMNKLKREIKRKYLQTLKEEK